MYVTPKAVSICWINGSWLSSSSGGRVASSFVLRQHLVAERAALHIECDGKMVWMFGIDHLRKHGGESPDRVGGLT